MEFQELQQLMQQFDDSSIRVFDLEDQSFHLLLSKDKMEGITPKTAISTQEVASAETLTVPTSSEVNKTPSEVTPPAEQVLTGQVVHSPLVGVTYLSPSPADAAFKKVGDVVKKGDVLCIVEAMKVMNEIVSEYEGTVTEILIENEEVVEFGQPLFRIS